MYQSENSINNKKMLLILGVGIIVLSVILVVFMLNDNKKTDDNIKDETEQIIPPKEEEKEPELEEPKKEELKIVDINSNSRPIAVMINNHPDARILQSGLQDAYLIYEMNVEYGLTRLMALYKDKNTNRIGSVRSSRHTFLDYVLENDALYVHFGWSYLAESQLPQLGINNLNGLYDNFFWRDTTLNVAYEHTAFTNMANIKQNAKSKGYRMTSNKELLLNYSSQNVNLSSREGNITANNITLNFSPYTVNTFRYNASTKTYSRLINGVEILDYVTKKPLTVKNIIAIKVNNWTLQGTTLQDFANIGEGDGYYITNGKALPIKWYKNSRNSQTVYKYLSGEEITVNDGNTYIGIVPLGNTVILN